MELSRTGQLLVNPAPTWEPLGHTASTVSTDYRCPGADPLAQFGTNVLRSERDPIAPCAMAEFVDCHG